MSGTERRPEQKKLLMTSTNLLTRISSWQKKFLAEMVGTFLLVVLATGSVVADAKSGGALGLPFVAVAPVVGVAIGVYLFRKVSMAHFNPAVSLGFFITGHITRRQFAYYLAAEIIGALLATLFVLSVMGTEANLGVNAPNYSYPLPLIFGIEVLATALLMTTIYIVVFTKGLKGFSGIAIGGIVGLDIFFLTFVSGASMNPARSLAPALLSGVLADLWLYCTATFVGTASIAFFVRRRFEGKYFVRALRNR